MKLAIVFWPRSVLPAKMAPKEVEAEIEAALAPADERLVQVLLQTERPQNLVDHRADGVRAESRIRLSGIIQTGAGQTSRPADKS